METTRTLTLTEFLLAQFAEDEAVARAASTLWLQDATTGEYGRVPGEPAVWVTRDGYGSGAVERTNGEPREIGIVVYDEGSPSDAEAAHIARHDPARALAEIEAKRRIISLASAVQVDMERLGPGREVRVVAEDKFLRILALPYADHPDYDPDWRP